MSSRTKVDLQLSAITPFLEKLMTILNICTSLLACWVVMDSGKSSGGRRRTSEVN